ncbi:MAG: 2-amino-4-hydroxy-6-hydroxymethyldihydropteridine diphosphokinase [Anaerolineales bacterium]|nr:2-amino-4-hydroxy-6-hydroxymethyldihydropteridine diphosphokinase [Anaerolineales bacterium]
MMNELHRAYLNLGSNIEPEKNLPQAVKLLKDFGNIEAISSVWETKSVGYDSANFLNACVLLLTSFEPGELKEKIIRPIERQLGRIRNGNKNAPRTIDIDVVLFDQTPHNLETWNHAFVIIPLTELIPNFEHPVEKKMLGQVAEQNQVWIIKRTDVTIF